MPGELRGGSSMDRDDKTGEEFAELFDRWNWLYVVVGL
jgi:hypothetical protein